MSTKAQLFLYPQTFRAIKSDDAQLKKLDNRNYLFMLGVKQTFKSRYGNVDFAVNIDITTRTNGYLLSTEYSKRVVFPTDQVVASACDETAETHVVRNEEIPSDKMGLDIGPESIKDIKAVVKAAKTIIWNGPMGVFEIDQFATGTNEVAQAVADNTEAITIVGGGDSVAAVRKAKLDTYMSHISTGGGASLEFLEGKMRI